MVRLGLSDSMRSTVSLEDTEPLHTASHRRSLRRAPAASVSAATDSCSYQQKQKKTASPVLLNPLRTILGAVLAAVLLSTSINMLGASLRTWRGNVSPNTEQFERLERKIALLERDTSRFKTTADKFLQSCQDAQVAASTRTEMLQNSAKRNFQEQMRTQIQEHEQVMRDVLQFYAQQEQKVMETRERLIQMNITMPLQIAVKPVPETWQQHRETADGVSAVARELSEKTLQSGDYHRLSVENVLVQTTELLESNNRRQGVERSSSYGSVFFYIVVVCASAVYLRNAISDKKELMEDKWSWSPVPRVLSRLKKWLSSVVVIEDLRPSSNSQDFVISAEPIEHIELR